MAFSSSYSNGRFKWMGTKQNQLLGVAPTTTVTPPPDNVITGLYGLDIKTNVQGKSVKVVSFGNIIAHFSLDEIASWDLTGNSIIINSDDQTPITLLFVNDTEATLGDSRLLICSNGGIVS
jgi:hypothetical protein